MAIDRDSCEKNVMITYATQCPIEFICLHTHTHVLKTVIDRCIRWICAHFIKFSCSHYSQIQLVYEWITACLRCVYIRKMNHTKWINSKMLSCEVSGVQWLRVIVEPSESMCMSSLVYVGDRLLAFLFILDEFWAHCEVNSLRICGGCHFCCHSVILACLTPFIHTRC